MRTVCLPFQYSVGEQRAARLPTPGGMCRKHVMFLSIKGWGYNTERMCTGVCRTTSNRLRFPVFGSSCSSSPRSTSITIVSVWDICSGPRLFLLEKCSVLGTFKASWRVHGPGPIKFAAISEGMSCRGESVV